MPTRHAGKIHLRADANGLPIGVVLSGGEVYDSKAIADLMVERDRVLSVLLADKGYDDDAIRAEMRFHGGHPETPTRRNRRVQHTIDRTLHVCRNQFERTFNKPTSSRTTGGSRRATTRPKPASSVPSKSPQLAVDQVC